MKSLWSCVFAVAATGAVVAVSACGSSVDAGAFADNPGDAASGGDTSAGGSDTGGDTGTPFGEGGPKTDSGAPIDTGTPPVDTGTPPVDTGTPPVDTGPSLTLDTVCDRLADAICGATTSACCATRSISYDAGGCRTGVLTFCGTEVDEVKAGKRTFDPSKFDGCASAWRTLTTTCSVPILTFIKDYAVCNELLNGTVPPGGGCTNDSDCHSEGGAFANCRGSGTCENISIVGKGSPCDFGGVAVRRHCDYGFYCSTSGGTGGGGVCKTERPTGSTCSGPSDTSCGFGNTCRSGKCEPGAPEGTGCSASLECASWSCGGGGVCSNPNAEMASPGTCNGG